MNFIACQILVGLCAVFAAQAVESIGGKEPARAARSVHLQWPAPATEAFYVEMIAEQSTAGSYFMACGWSGGYFGIQELGAGKKVVIFSVWDTAHGDDPNNVNESNRVEVLHSGEGTRIKRFGGEGTGGQCMMDWPWQIGATNRFLVRSASADGKTAFAGYIFDAEKHSWRHLVTFRRRGSGAMSGLYSFVEDFRRDVRSVKDTRRARFQNAWVTDKHAQWQPLKSARFTASGAEWEARDNISAGAIEAGWFLATGGDIRREHGLNGRIEARLPPGPPPTGLPVEQVIPIATTEGQR